MSTRPDVGWTRERLAGLPEEELLRAVASAERRSEHPLARAMVAAATERGLQPVESTSFTPYFGRGVVAEMAATSWAVGNRTLLAERGIPISPEAEAAAAKLEQEEKTTFFAARGGEVAGLVAVADTVRPDAAAALQELTRLGMRQLLLLTGDNERVAAAIAGPFGLTYRAGLLPEDKIAAIKELQAAGRTVLMVGDSVNDAPTLAQADVRVAMAVAGTDVANVALMREDWRLVPEFIRLGRRAARTIRQNLDFTVIYNLLGFGLAASGLLPPVWAAAAQSVPDMAILLNSARLLRRRS